MIYQTDTAAPSVPADAIERFILVDAIMMTKAAVQQRAQAADTALAADRIQNLLATVCANNGGGNLTLTLDEPLHTPIGQVIRAAILLIGDDIVDDIIYTTTCGERVSLNALGGKKR